MKKNASAVVTMSVDVPRGLVAFLDKIDTFTGRTPKQHIEWVLQMEMECLLGCMPGDIFDLKLIKATYGEGSRISEGLVE
jgi:hypothetical protein